MLLIFIDVRAINWWARIISIELLNLRIDKEYIILGKSVGRRWRRKEAEVIDRVGSACWDGMWEIRSNEFDIIIYFYFTWNVWAEVMFSSCQATWPWEQDQITVVMTSSKSKTPWSSSRPKRINGSQLRSKQITMATVGARFLPKVSSFRFRPRLPEARIQLWSTQ